MKLLFVLFTIIFGLSFLIFPSSFGEQSDFAYFCDSSKVDSEWLVYEFTTKKINDSVVSLTNYDPEMDREEVLEYLYSNSDLDLWYSLRDCLESYGINPEVVIESTPKMHKYLEISKSENSESFEIPSWIKESANSWVEDKGSVYSFTNAISFLSKTNVWDDSIIIQNAYGSSPKIPTWLQDYVSWWLEGSTSDQEFIDGIEFFVKVGTIKI